MTDKQELFLHLKPAKIMAHLNNPMRENYVSKISEEVDCTYSHTVKVIQELEKHGLVESNNHGRRKVLELTEEGRKIAKTTSELLTKLR